MAGLNLNELKNEAVKIRKEIVSLQEERQWLETSKLSKADLISRFNNRVDNFAEEQHVVKKMSADMNPFEQRVGLLAGGIDGVNLGPMLCSLFGDEIKQKMAAKINALDYEAGPPLSERTKLLDQNSDQLKQLELAEEAMICEAEQLGWLIERRHDIRPDIFLEWNEH